MVDKNVDNLESCPQITQAAELLQKNEVVALPTETVYGLAGNANDDKAIVKIFSAKGRPADNPLIIHIGDFDQLNDIVSEVSNEAKKLMKAFWPGPLTLVLKKKFGTLSNRATAGLSTVAVRMPNHPIALAIIKKCKLPIAAPSANQSGKPSPTTAKHVYADLAGKISAIVDGGPTNVGVESTVVDCTENPPIILRPGGITKEQLEEVIKTVAIDQALIDKGAAPKSPGMKYRHYAPNAPFFLVEGSRSFLQQLADEKRAAGLRIGILTTEEYKDEYEADVVLACGERRNLESVASHLYETLRTFNDLQVDIIYGEVFPPIGVGQAIMNRLSKAAGNQLIKEINES
ncbi:threonylcarbamoyl-AMP synthase [Bacillus aquiflavi]|nr:threonylcarbamoyl-AMP synthase [Bacillus aquiflavi]